MVTLHKLRAVDVLYKDRLSYALSVPHTPGWQGQGKKACPHWPKRDMYGKPVHSCFF